MPPLEEGGPIARGGYAYQDHAAAAFCLEMFQDETVEAVWCETQDDILLDRRLNGARIVEFIQVKSDQPNQLWSIAMLCGRETRNGAKVVGSSILDKQLARDRGDEQAHFRLVSLRDVNADLSILRQAPERRDQAALGALITNIEAEVGAYTSPKGNGVDYWVRNMQWDVRESAQALENSNLLALEQHLNEALRPLTNSFANARQLLILLAARSTDLGDSPVPATDIASSVLDLQPLVATHLVTEERGAFSFTVATVAHWFAAEALRSGAITPDELVENPDRLERWRFPLAVFVGTGSFTAVSLCLEVLARTQPAFAGLILQDAIRDWHLGRPCPLPPAQELADRIYRTVLAWREGLGPLAARVLPSNQRQEPMRLAVVIDAPRHVTCCWHNDTSVPQVWGTAQAPAGDVGSFEIWGDVAGDQPAWVWRQSQSQIRSSLARLVRNREFTLDTGPLAKGIAWNEACRRTVKSGFQDVSISLEELCQTRPRFPSEQSRGHDLGRRNPEASGRG